MPLQSDTLQFLKDLSTHNEKPWFDENRKRYEAAKKNMEAFTTAILNGLTIIDPDIGRAGLVPKDCIMRIFRDVRFSKDKTPYKTNFFAYFTKGGRKSIHAGYYICIEPNGKSFSGGGIYMPENPELAKIRQEIAYEFPAFEEIIKGTAFLTEFPDGLQTTDTLSRPPQGYSADHAAIEYLKNKSFFSTRYYADEELTSPEFADRVLRNLKAAVSLVQFINRSFD